MTDERLNKAENLTNERLSLAEQNIAMSIERSVIEHQKMTDGRLKKAEQQLAEANRRAEDMEAIRICDEEIREQLAEANRRAEDIEAIRIRDEEIRIQAEERNREISYQLLARAEKAEKQVQEAVESAARLEQKFMDAMKQISTTGMSQRLNVVLADTHT